MNMETVTENLNNLAMNENEVSESPAVADVVTDTPNGDPQTPGPEPQPGSSSQTEEPKSKENCLLSGHTCKCDNNCADLMAKLSECIICFHPLQNTGINACGRCGGFWCGECAKRMACCPFCRAPPPSAPCLALRRLLRDLILPCRNQRWGCKVLVSTDSRRAHEVNCAYGHIRCPMSDDCMSTFTTGRLVSHILKKHEMTAIETHILNIKIEDFSTKMSNSNVTKYKYATLLIAYGNLFLVKVSLKKFNLDVKILKKELEYAIQYGKQVALDESYCAILSIQSKTMNNRYKVVLDEDYYAKKTLLDENDSTHKSWPGEDVSVFVTIAQLKDNINFHTVTM